MTRLTSYLGWVLPFFIPGFLAPILFRNLEPRLAGHIAGAFFVLATFWAMYVARRHFFPAVAIWFFRGCLILNAVFWSWRFFNPLPLTESFLLGLSGPQWHQILTKLYLAQALALVLGLSWSRKRNFR